MKNYLIIFLSLLCVSISALANRPLIKNYYNKEYKAENKNWSITEDEIGFLYFGNDGGLLQYDGIEWELFTMEHSSIVRSVIATSHDELFSGGYEEFGRWIRNDAGKLEYNSLSKKIDKSNLRNEDFWKIAQVDSLIYFQSFKSIYVYDGDSIAPIVSENGFYFLHKVDRDIYVQKINGALYKVVGYNLEKIPESDFLKDFDVRVVLPFALNQLLIGTSSHGIYHYDGKQFRKWENTFSNVLRKSELNSGVKLESGNYLFGTILGGLFEVKNTGEIVNVFSTDNMLQNNTILSLYQDSSQNVWVGMDKGIASIQYFPNFDCYINFLGKIPTVYDATLWLDKLFFATNQGVYYLLISDMKKPNVLSYLNFINGTQGQAWSLKVIADKIFIGHNNGLKSIDAKMTVRNEHNIGTGVFNITSIDIYREKSYVLNTYNSARIFNPATNSIFQLIDMHEPILNAESDYLDNLWLEHFNRGVYRCRLNNELSQITDYKYYGGDSEDGLPYKMKIFKVGGRVMFFGDDNFYTYNDIEDQIVKSEVLNQCFKSVRGIKNIISNSDYEFWALGRSFLCKFSFDGYSAEILEYHSFNNTLSLVSNYENISLLTNLKIIVCLDNGFLLYDGEPKNHYVENLQAPQLLQVESSNKIGDSKYLTNKKAVVHSGYNERIKFTFTSSKILDQSLKFQYKLSGVDPEWSLPIRINNVIYQRLLPGNYSFQIRTINELGETSESLIYDFRVSLPWYQTPWMIFIYCIVFCFVIYIGWATLLKRYRTKHLQKIRQREAKRLRHLAEKLQTQLDAKNAELLTQTSFLVQRNELIIRIKEILEPLRTVTNNQKIRDTIRNIDLHLNNIDVEKDWKNFLIVFEEKHPYFFKKLKSIYPELTVNDLRLCACLKLNLESKDIATLINLSLRAVENSRYRLRKKLNLSPDQNLNEFIINI